MRIAGKAMTAMVVWAIAALAASGSRAAGAPPADAVLVVGGKPEGLEVPGTELALRARKACELMLQDKARYLIVSGKEFTNTQRLLWVTRLKHMPDRSKEQRIRSCDMLAIMAFSRGIGRLAIRMVPDPADVPAMLRAKGYKRVLVVGDGAGPERPAVAPLAADATGAAPIKLEFIPPHSDRQAAEAALQADCTFTQEELAGAHLKALPAKADVVMIHGTSVDWAMWGVIQAVKLYKAGRVKYIFPTGACDSHINEGEWTAIMCTGLGVPIDRLVYDPVMGSNRNEEQVARWCRSKGFTSVITSRGKGKDMVAGSKSDKGGVEFYLGDPPAFVAVVPRDAKRQIDRIMAEFRQHAAAHLEGLAKTLPARELADATRLVQRQLGEVQSRMETGFSNGRGYYPYNPWDWDGISPFTCWKEQGWGGGQTHFYPRAAYRGVVGESKDVESGEGKRWRLLIADLGARGCWQELTDSRIKVVPDRWERYEGPPKPSSAPAPGKEAPIP